LLFVPKVVGVVLQAYFVRHCIPLWPVQAKMVVVVAVWVVEDLQIFKPVVDQLIQPEHS
jgi:hypothetical protein